MYRREDEQKEMITVCGMLIDYIFDVYGKKELDKVEFISKCSFACGYIYATFGDSERFEFMEATIKLLIDTYQSVGGADNEKEWFFK